MPTRAFDCPSTGQTCTNAQCQVMHCEEQRVAREANRGLPAHRRRMLESAGWTMWNGGVRPIHELDHVDVVWASGDEIFNSANRLYWGGDTDRSDRIVAYRVRIPHVEPQPVAGGEWVEWPPGSGRPPYPDDTRIEVRFGDRTDERLIQRCNWNYGTPIRAYRLLDVQPVTTDDLSSWQMRDGVVCPYDGYIDLIHASGREFHHYSAPNETWDAIRGSDYAIVAWRPSQATSQRDLGHTDTLMRLRAREMAVFEQVPFCGAWTDVDALADRGGSSYVEEFRDYITNGSPTVTPPLAPTPPTPSPSTTEAWVVGREGSNFILINRADGTEVLMVRDNGAGFVRTAHRDLAQQLTAFPMMLSNEMPGPMAEAIAINLQHAPEMQALFGSWVLRHREAYAQAEADRQLPTEVGWDVAETDDGDEAGMYDGYEDEDESEF